MKINGSLVKWEKKKYEPGDGDDLSSKPSFAIK